MVLEENLNNDKKLNEINEEKIKEMEEKEKEKENIKDFDENTFYKEIIRFGLNIKPEIKKEEKSSIDLNEVTSKDLIE